jgi:hypothetical protein
MDDIESEIYGWAKDYAQKNGLTCLRHYLSKKLSQTLTPNQSN